MFENKRTGTVWRWVLGFFVFSFLLFSAGPSYSADIHEINAAIQAMGAKWVAKETPLSHLSPEEMQGWMGALEGSTDSSMPIYPSFDTNVPLIQSSFDWTNHGGNYVTPIRDQHGCGGCWAFATTAVLESKSLITFNMPNQELDLSEQIVLSCTGGQNTCAGGAMEQAAQFLENYGTNLQSCYPYTSTNGNCSQACANWQTDPYKIDSWSLIYPWNATDINALKNAVVQRGPVVVWFKVYEDFKSYGEGVYSYSSGNYVGNHFVVVVGWDDSAGGVGALHVKNSWGTNWGEGGFCWIAYSELFGSGNSTTEFAKGAMAFGNAIHSGLSSSQKPNLTPYQPQGWSDKIVVSNVTGTTTDANPPYPTDTLYVDFAVINDSDVAINSTFYVALYVDGALNNTWHWDSMNAHNYGYVTDYSIGSLSAGTHTIKIVADSTDVIDESNESDNEYTKTITIQGQPTLPNLTPYQPQGWSDKIVVSNVTGTTTDAGPLTTTDTLYVNWAVVNNSSVNILNHFQVSLYVDGGFTNSWYTDSLNAGYYVYNNDYAIGMLGAGTHTLKIVADSNREINESNKADNQYTKTITVEVASPNGNLPNLTPYQPKGWSDVLVVSNSTGSRIDSNPITFQDNLYINWAVINNGPVATPGGFSVDLYIDGVLINSWSRSSPLKSNNYWYLKDYPIGTLSPGDHFLELFVDSNYEISESNENDNYYAKQITVQGPFFDELFPNLRPYQPKGWSDKMVISTSRKTFTDSPFLTIQDTLYVDWAVIDDSPVGISKGFSVNLYVDGVLKKTWKLQALGANSNYAVKNYSIGKLSAGFHTLTIVVDPAGVILEEVKGDNEYTKTIEVLVSFRGVIGKLPALVEKSRAFPK
jgi:hypothetical protein